MDEPLKVAHRKDFKSVVAGLASSAEPQAA